MIVLSTYPPISCCSAAALLPLPSSPSLMFARVSTWDRRRGCLRLKAIVYGTTGGDSALNQRRLRLESRVIVFGTEGNCVRIGKENKTQRGLGETKKVYNMAKNDV